MKYDLTRKLLINHLRNNAAVLGLDPKKQIALENVVFDPKSMKKVWVQPIFMPGRGYAATCGPGGYDRAQGLLQVNIKAPLGSATKDFNTLMDGIMQLYKRGTALRDAGSNFYVMCQRVFASAALQDAGWYYAPVSIEWYSYICNE